MGVGEKKKQQPMGHASGRVDTSPSNSAKTIVDPATLYWHQRFVEKNFVPLRHERHFRRPASGHSHPASSITVRAGRIRPRSACAKGSGTFRGSGPLRGQNFNRPISAGTSRRHNGNHEVLVPQLQLGRSFQSTQDIYDNDVDNFSRAMHGNYSLESHETLHTKVVEQLSVLQTKLDQFPVPNENVGTTVDNEADNQPEARNPIGVSTKTDGLAQSTKNAQADLKDQLALLNELVIRMSPKGLQSGEQHL